MFQKKCSKILKLPSVRNCFTLAMTDKLVVIINSLKVPKIKKILLCEMKFLVPNYSCLQNPLPGGLPPPDPRSLCPQLNLLNPPPPPADKIPGYATGYSYLESKEGLTLTLTAATTSAGILISGITSVY